jgi:stage IV sporulation protein FB
MFKIPIRINPFFWLFALLIGWLNSKELSQVLVWVFVIFVSILVHELGHALFGIFFKQKASIEIAPFGGLTVREGPKLNLGREFIVVLMGPFFGFALFLLASFLVTHTDNRDSLLYFGLTITAYVNLVWTVLNLLPILPLDGGHLLRIILEKFFGFKGIKGVHYISFVLAILLTLITFAFGQLFLGVLFFMLAFFSFKSLKNVNQMTVVDEDIKLQEDFEEAERKLIMGMKEEALNDFIKLRDKTKNGMIHNIATETSALIMLENQQLDIVEKKRVYNYLSSLPNLSTELIPALHRLSFETGNVDKTIEIADESYQLSPLPETALINAMAYAIKNKVEPCIGWLDCALSDGNLNANEILQKSEFDSVRHFKEFKKLFSEDL